MKSQQTTEMCQKCLEALTGSEKHLHDPECLAHLESCPACAQMLTAIEHLRHEGSAFAGDSHPDLKMRIMRSLEPALAQRRTGSNPATSTAGRSWFWQLLSGVAVLMIAVISLIVTRPPTVVDPPAPVLVTARTPTTFKMVINGKAPTQVSLDNPVSLFADESAAITIPDGSTLQVSGPARLNILPRGFHLVQGRLQADVAKGGGEFICSTPHGQITVLGTVFKVETDQRKTLVEVVSGRVRVQADGQAPIILEAGAHTELHHPESISTQTETIPAVDSE
jgi:hypothetical protein